MDRPGSAGPRGEVGAEAGRLQSLQSPLQSPNLSDPKWWEACARTQIIKHPRVALGLGLVAGLMVGYWVKR
jgi:hypothetical protein